MIDISQRNIACHIDHTLLKPEATEEEILRICEEAKQYGFATVCVNGRWLPLVAEKLHESPVKVGGVVSLPFGADSTKIKLDQATEAIFSGADEVDMVCDLAAIIEGNSRYLSSQFRAVVKICRSMRPAVTLKVIIESAALTREQKIFACRIAETAGVDFIKTSTGFHPAGGATIEDIKLMKEAAPTCKIKAAGGIRTLKQAIEMLDADAERIGTSSGVQIIQQLQTGHTE